MEIIADKIVEALETAKLIQHNQKEIYQYTIECILENFVNVISIFAVSMFFQNTLETMLFVLFFFSIRSRCGGFHLNSFKDTVTFWAADSGKSQISDDYDQKLGSSAKIIFNKSGYNKPGKQIMLGMENAHWYWKDRAFVAGDVDYR